MRRILGLAAVTAALFAGSMSAHAQIEEKKFNVIGGWNFINNWKKVEFPYWSEMVAKNTGGKITANIKSITEVNLKGTEVLRLLKTGVYDVAAALPIYVDDGGAVIEAVDISAVAQSPEMQREILQAWLPEMQKVMKERYNSQIMATIAYPQQSFFCRDEINSIADLKLRDACAHLHN